jgi:nucleotide-binding universal stress UspA family protein
MTNKQVKISNNYLVLIDFSEASYHALKYAISLAKLIKGNIHVCYIGNPSIIENEENQFAALRELNTATQKIKNKMGAIVEMIIVEGINAIPHCSFGNIIDEFKELKNLIQPDVVVLGKKVEGNPKLSGKFTNYLLHKYEGSLLIVGENSFFQEETEIYVASNKNTFDVYDPHLIFSINKQTKVALKLVYIKTDVDSTEQINLPQTWRGSMAKIEENIDVHLNSTVSGGLSHYLKDKEATLLCIGRGKPIKFLERIFSKSGSIVSNVVHQINTPVLVMGTHSD